MTIGKEFTTIATIAGFDIAIREDKYNQYTVTYGQQKRIGLDYYAACKEIGQCVMHALACDGVITIGDDE